MIRTISRRRGSTRPGDFGLRLLPPGRSQQRRLPLENPVPDHHRPGGKGSLRHRGPVRRLHPAGQGRLSAGVHPRRSGLSGKANRGGIRRAGKIPRTASEGQGQTPRRLSPLLHRHEVGSRAKLRPDTQQRHTGNRQMRRNHQEPVLKNIPSTKGSITKRQENHLLPFFLENFKKQSKSCIFVRNKAPVCGYG